MPCPHLTCPLWLHDIASVPHYHISLLTAVPSPMEDSVTLTQMFSQLALRISVVPVLQHQYTPEHGIATVLVNPNTCSTLCHWHFCLSPALSPLSTLHYTRPTPLPLPGCARNIPVHKNTGFEYLYDPPYLRQWITNCVPHCSMMPTKASVPPYTIPEVILSTDPQTSDPLCSSVPLPSINALASLL